MLIDFCPIQNHGKCPYSFLGPGGLLSACPFISPVQANWRSSLRAVAGKVRILDVQSTPMREKLGLGVFAQSLCTEPEGMVARSVFASTRTTSLFSCDPGGL